MSSLRRWALPLLTLLALSGHPPLATADGSWWPVGECTWYVAARRPEANLWASGNAWNWANAAEVTGKPTGSQPAVGAVYVAQPGIEGAGLRGHVGIVDQVEPDGVHFLLSEMNYTKLGWEDQRWLAVGRGVRFVY